MAKPKPTPKKKDAPEPSRLMRFVADQFYTTLVASIIVAGMSAWVMHDTTAAGRDIPGPLYAYLAVGLLVAGLHGLAYTMRRAELETVWKRRRAFKETKILLREVARCRKRYAYRLGAPQLEELAAAESGLIAARSSLFQVRNPLYNFFFGVTPLPGDWDQLAAALNALDAKLDEHLAFARKSTAREYAESIGVAVLIALLLRSFVVEAFRIPSGSMIPTLQVGDHIFVNKFIYGVRVPFTDIKFGMNLRKPERGEIIVFKYPKDPDKDFIKRIVAVEGDSVEIRDNVPWVNGKPVDHQRIPGECEYDDKSEDTDHWEHRQCVGFEESLDRRKFEVIYNVGEGARSWPSQKVPPQSVFVMGDNRDNSHDSRYWGFVPYELIKGKAMIIWWSSGQPEGIRVKRMGQLVQ